MKHFDLILASLLAAMVAAKEHQHHHHHHHHHKKVAESNLRGKSKDLFGERDLVVGFGNGNNNNNGNNGNNNGNNPNNNSNASSDEEETENQGETENQVEEEEDETEEGEEEEEEDEEEEDEEEEDEEEEVTEEAEEQEEEEEEQEEQKNENSGKKPAVTGDPHFVMWSGEKFDFHGGCDLVLIQDPDFNHGQGLYIHIRTKIQRWWSYVDSAVVQIGDDTLEVMGGVERKRYFVNGQEGAKLDTSGRMPFTVGGYPVRYRHLNDKQFQFKIFLNNDQNIVLKAVKDFMRVDIENPRAESFGTSVGLMGSFQEGERLARDGITIIKDTDAFGKEWQVLSTEPMLFHNVEGVQHPEVCAMPSMTEEKRRLEGSISREMAKKACAHVSASEKNDCIFDVMATNDIDMAGSY